MNWIVEEFVSMHIKTTTILPMNGSLYTRSNVARLFLPRKDSERELIGIKGWVNKKRKALYGYLRIITEWVLQ